MGHIDGFNQEPFEILGGESLTHTLYIGDDICTARPEHIFNEDDFMRMVFERLGPDAERYVKSVIEERNDAIK